MACAGVARWAGLRGEEVGWPVVAVLAFAVLVLEEGLGVDHEGVAEQVNSALTKRRNSRGVG